MTFRAALAKTAIRCFPHRSAAALMMGFVLTLTPVLPASADVAKPVTVTGAIRLLVIAVRFPGTEVSHSLEQVGRKVENVSRFIRTASYGRAWVEPKLTGWHEMPARLEEYAVSPFNFQVDRQRVRRLLADALAVSARAEDFSRHDVVWIVVGARTAPGEGYGMIAYCANPGMLSGVRKGRAELESVTLPDGRVFAKGAIVSADNAHMGHAAHDLLHALGGSDAGRRVVPDLYDYDMQSDPALFRRIGKEDRHPRHYAVHTGPWDIMSQHFIDRAQAPPPPSSFTRRQLGWIGDDQIAVVPAGETREATLQPLARGRGTLAVRIPMGARRYLLLENRQPVEEDRVLPAHGLVVLEVDEALEEGSALVRAANANPSRRDLYAAPFVPGTGERRYYVSPDKAVAVAPLKLEPGGGMRVVVTVPARIGEFVSASR